MGAPAAGALAAGALAAGALAEAGQAEAGQARPARVDWALAPRRAASARPVRASVVPAGQRAVPAGARAVSGAPRPAASAAAASCSAAGFPAASPGSGLAVAPCCHPRIPWRPMAAAAIRPAIRGAAARRQAAAAAPDAAPARRRVRSAGRGSAASGETGVRPGRGWGRAVARARRPSLAGPVPCAGAGLSGWLWRWLSCRDGRRADLSAIIVDRRGGFQWAPQAIWPTRGGALQTIGKPPRTRALDWMRA
jgi:hypothetical protein